MATSISTIASGKVDTVFQEPFTSETLNKRFRAFSRGVIRGFVPVPGAGNDELELHVDAVAGDSVANVGGTGMYSDMTLSVRETSTVTLDLSTLAAADWYVTVRTNYSAGLPTVSDYLVYSEAEILNGDAENDGAVFLCRVTTTGNVGVLDPDEFALMDHNFVRTEAVSTEGPTSKGMLHSMYTIDGGDPFRRYVSLATGGSGLVQTTPGNSGFGALEWTPSAAAETLVLNNEVYFPASTGDFVHLEVVLSSTVEINVGVSGLFVQEFDASGTLLATNANTVISNTGGVYAPRRASYRVREATTAFVRPFLSIFSAAAGTVLVDKVTFYASKRNLDYGSDGGLVENGVQPALTGILQVGRTGPTPDFSDIFTVDHETVGVLSVTRNGGGTLDVGDGAGPIGVNVSGALTSDGIGTFNANVDFNAGAAVVGSELTFIGADAEFRSTSGVIYADGGGIDQISTRRSTAGPLAQANAIDHYDVAGGRYARSRSASSAYAHAVLVYNNGLGEWEVEANSMMVDVANSTLNVVSPTIKLDTTVGDYILEAGFCPQVTAELAATRFNVYPTRQWVSSTDISVLLNLTENTTASVPTLVGGETIHITVFGEPS